MDLGKTVAGLGLGLSLANGAYGISSENTSFEENSNQYRSGILEEESLEAPLRFSGEAPLDKIDSFKSNFYIDYNQFILARVNGVAGIEPRECYAENIGLASIRNTGWRHFFIMGIGRKII